MQVDLFDLLAKDGIGTRPGNVVGVIRSTLDCQGDIGYASVLKGTFQDFFDGVMANGFVELVGVNA